MAGFLSRLKGVAKSWLSGVEGSWRGPFFGQGELGGFFRLGSLEDGWQRNLRVDRFTLDRIPVVEGGVNLYSNAFAQLRPMVHEYGDAGRVTRNETHAAARVLVSPNTYESGADLQSRLIAMTIVHGEALVLGLRNDRAERSEMHLVPPGTWSPVVDPETKAIFYAINADGALLSPTDATMAAPARDVLHFRWKTPRHPLIGESPLKSAALAAGVSIALSESQAAFFSQMRRPSGVLSTDEKLKPLQIRELRDAFDEQSARWASGGMPILSHGLKFQPLSISSQDAEVISTMRMSNEEIARALGIPPPLVGDLTHATLANVEQMVSAWLSFSLGGLIERYERALDRFFGLNSRTMRVDMDVTPLLRTDLGARMEAYGRGVQGGILTPNECRAREGLTAVDGADDLFLQRQMTSVSLLADLNAQELEDKRTAATAPPPAPEPAPEPDPDVTRILVRAMIQDKISARKAAAHVH